MAFSVLVSTYYIYKQLPRYWYMIIQDYMRTIANRFYPCGKHGDDRYGIMQLPPWEQLYRSLAYPSPRNAATVLHAGPLSVYATSSLAGAATGQ